jgi:Flp pilus assembly protein TadB
VTTRPPSRLPPTPTQLPSAAKQGIRYWLGQLWSVLRKALIFAFAGFGIVLLARFAPKALIILIPLAFILFGTGLYSWLRAMMRDKRSNGR